MTEADLTERIFQRCLEEFKENGVRFTMDSLAKRIGISKRTLYETIPSKNEIVTMVVEKTFADVKNQQRVILADQTLCTVDKIKRLFTVVPTYVNVVDYRRMNEIRVSYPKLYQYIQERLETDWEPTIMLLEQAMSEGVIRKVNITILRLLLCQVYENLINGEELIKNHISYETAMQEAIGIIFEGVLVRA